MRRTTLGSISSSQQNRSSNNASSRVSIGASQSPVRQSLGGHANRVSVSSIRPPAPPPRHSISRTSVGSTNASQTPLRGRNSVAGIYQHSRYSRGTGTTRRDPRPIADKAYRNECKQMIIEFLVERQYNHPISKKMFDKTTKKEIFNVLLFLFRQIDPSYQYSGKFEEDILNQFKLLKYPINISKTVLAASGALHTLPVLIAAITWLVELIKESDQLKQDKANGDYGHADHAAERKFLMLSYKNFLAGNDAECARLEEAERQRRIELINKKKMKVNELAKRKQELQQKIQQLRKEKSLSVVKAKREDYVSDQATFQKLVARLESDQTIWVKKIQDRKTMIAKEEEQLKSRQDSIREVQERIAQQKLSSEDVELMRAHRRRLNEQCESVTQAQKDVEAAIRQDELTVTQHIDDIERDVQKYTTQAMELKLIPTVAKNAKGVDYSLKLNSHEDSVEAAKDLSVQLRHHIGPALENFCSNRKDRLYRIQDEIFALKAEVQKGAQNCTLEAQATELVEDKVRNIDENGRRNWEKQIAATKQIREMEKEVEANIQTLLDERDVINQEIMDEQRIDMLRKKLSVVKEQRAAAVSEKRSETTYCLLANVEMKEQFDEALRGWEKEMMITEKTLNEMGDD